MKTSVVLTALLVLSLFSPVAHTMEQTQAEKVFRHFCMQWIKTKSSHSTANIICTVSDNAYVAEYTSFGPDFDVQIKQNGNTLSSYVGILKYKGTKFKSRGATHDTALNGLFNRAYEYPVTEIFLYKDGKWHY